MKKKAKIPTRGRGGGGLLFGGGRGGALFGRGGRGALEICRKSAVQSKSKAKRERSRSRERMPKVVSSSNSELKQLISLQSINGSWSLNSALISMIKSSGLKLAVEPA